MNKLKEHPKERFILGVTLAIVTGGLIRSPLGLFAAAPAAFFYDDARNKAVEEYHIDGKLVFIMAMLIPVLLGLIILAKFWLLSEGSISYSVNSTN